MVPLRPTNPRHLQGASVALHETLRTDVLMEGLAVCAVENYSAPEFIPEEGLEEREHHVKDVGLVNYVDVFDPEGNAVLKRKEGDI